MYMHTCRISARIPSRADVYPRRLAFARDVPEGDERFGRGRLNHEVMRSASQGVCGSFSNDARPEQPRQDDHPRGQKDRIGGGGRKHRQQ